MKKPKVAFKNVYKEYGLYISNKDKLIDLILNKGQSDSFYAVKDVSFEVYSGETIGVVGINGSGKSTLSNILAEVIPPTSGEIEIDGETSLIAISAGLNGQLSGFENIYLKCMMHGMSDEEIAEVEDKIVEFADIGSFMKQPVKNYSSGMKSRLGFAISVHTNPEILVIDEALSVGDETFYDKCLKKIDEFKRDGKTIFFISHSTAQLRNVSDRVIWMHYGEIKEFGEKDKVLNNYKEFIEWFNELTETEQNEYKNKMFAEQFPTEEDKIKLTEIKREVEKKEKKERTIFKFQSITMSLFTLVLSGFIVSGLSLGMGWDKVLGLELSGGQQNYIEIISSDEENAETIVTENEIVKINEEGYVQIDNASIYSDISMKNKKVELPLFEKVEVVEQINNEIYKIVVSGIEGYILLKDINIDKKLTEVDWTVESLLPYLSEGFSEAYLYYLSFLNESIDHLQATLQGDGQVEVQENSVVFEYQEGEIVYHSLDGEIIKQLELKISLDESTDLYKRITKNSLSNKDKTVFYLETKDYFYLIDLPKDKLIIEQKNSP